MGPLTIWSNDHGGFATVSLKMFQQVLLQEAKAVESLALRNHQELEQGIGWILACEGRVVTCGIGKSGHIAEKAAATFASTGTPSFFLHAAEAVHGDLGMVTRPDIVMAYTFSGETDEIVRLFPSFRQTGAKTILLTGRPESSAGRASDLVLDLSIEKEACPHNLAPTTSTTVMLAVSDGIAVEVMDRRNFTGEDFAKFHPAGSLGKRLILSVRDIMRQGEDLALVEPHVPVLDVMKSITRAGAGCACVVRADGSLVGFISDGDLRRWFVSGRSAMEGTASDLMSEGGPTVDPDLLAFDALESIQNYPRKIGELPVVEGGRVVGLLVLKDLLRSGIV